MTSLAMVGLSLTKNAVQSHGVTAQRKALIHPQSRLPKLW